ncbi:hypothetical protein RintRC_2381 [Richelia intracellularis]|nr:hypothetical protein RintRC_2381 [Richelia intracellularis]
MITAQLILIFDRSGWGSLDIALEFLILDGKVIKVKVKYLLLPCSLAPLPFPLRFT